MKKLLILCALLSFNIHAYMAVLDWNKVRSTFTAMLPDAKDTHKIIKKDVAEWAQQEKLNIIFFSFDDSGIYNVPYYSEQADGTQLFIDWLKKKYTCTQCLLHCQNHMDTK